MLIVFVVTSFICFSFLSYSKVGASAFFFFLTALLIYLSLGRVYFIQGDFEFKCEVNVLSHSCLSGMLNNTLAFYPFRKKKFVL